MKHSLTFLFVFLFSTVFAQKMEDYQLFYPNGLLQEEGRKSSTRKIGTLYVYDAQKHLVKKTTFDLQLKSPGNYIGSTYLETITTYNEKGGVVSTKSYNNGTFIKPTQETYSNGQLKTETIFAADQLHKTTITYYENGNKKYVSTGYDKNKRFYLDGMSEGYYESGQLSGKTAYKNGLKEGKSISYDEKGMILQDATYINDTVVELKRYNKLGKQTGYYAKDAPPESQFNKDFYPNDSVLKYHQYKKYVVVNGDSLLYDFQEHFLPDGSLKSKNVSWNGKGIFINSEIMAGKNYVSNSTFRLSRRTDLNVLELNTGHQLEQQGFFISSGMRFPFGSSQKDQQKEIKAGIDRVKNNIKEGNINEDHRIADSSFIPALAYYSRFPKEVLFEEAIYTSNLDETETGTFRIDYKGTDMYVEGSLLNGFLNGRLTLHLNKNQLLFDRTFAMGLENGTTKNWFLDGTLCDEMTFEKGRLVNSKKWYTNGQLYLEERYNKKQINDFKQKWSKEGKILEYQLLTDTLNTAFRFTPDGALESYTWNNLKDKINISKTIYKGRNFATIEIPHDENRPVNFSFSYGGVTISGKAYWDNQQQKSILEDDFGGLEQFDRSVISYPKELPCTCKGWEDYKFFAQATTDFVNEKTFLKYQHSFHAPLKDLSLFFGNPYSINQKPDSYKFGQTYYTYSYHFTPKPLSLFLPDSNGVELILEPCKSRFAFIRYEVSTNFKIGSQEETSAHFNKMKHIGMQFPASMMTQLDDEFQPLFDEKGKPYKGMFMFETNEVQYDILKQINVIQPRFMRGRNMLLGASGMELQATYVLPDFSETFNYPEALSFWNPAANSIDSIFNVLKVKQEEVQAFRGATVTSGMLYLPISTKNDMIPTEIEQLLISSTFCLGKVELSALLDSETGLYKLQNRNKDWEIIDVKRLVEQLKQHGILSTVPIFEPASSSFHFYIYYQKP